MAFTAIVGLVSGTAAVTATVVLAAVVEIGVAMTVVGAVTGSKALMKAGGVLSMVGGIGGMIAGAAGATGAVSATTVADAGAIGTEALAAEGAGAVAADTAATAGMEAVGQSANLGADLVGQELSAGLPDLAGTMNPSDMALANGTKLSPGMAEEAAATGLQAPSVAGAQSPTAVTGAQTPAGVAEAANPYTNPTDMRLAAQTQTSPGSAPESTSSFFDTFSKFADKHKTLINGGMQIAGGAFKGANDREMWDQKMANEQAALAQKSFGNTISNFAPRGILAGARA